MSKKTRDQLFILFIVFFVILTVFFSLYASGYKFSLSWPLKFNKLLQKTGMLIVGTVPSGATVYLNDKPQKDSSFKPWKKNYLTTGAKIRNILPAEYVLRLELAGYWPFEKKIKINSGETTFAEDINLFLAAEPLLITAAAEGDLSLSPNRKYLYLPTTKQIWNLKNNQARDLKSTATTSQWLTNDKLLIAGIIFSPEKASDSNYQKIIGTEATHWFYEETTGRLYYQNKNSLNRLEADGRTNTLILSGQDYLTYEPRGDHLYSVSGSAGKIIFQDYNLKNKKIDQELILPTVGQYRFVFDGQATLSLYDEKNKTLYLINPANLSADPITLKNTISWQWLNNGQLLYSNPWEIYLFDLKTNQVNLITRVSEEITKIIWHPDNNYLVFSTAQSLKTVDLKNGIIINLLSTEKIVNPVLDEKNDYLYFWAKIKGQAGIYKMLLQ